MKPLEVAWWASLTAPEIKLGLELVGSSLEHEVVDGVTYWFDPATFERAPSPLVRLLQGYDEYFVGHSPSTMHLLDLSRPMQPWLRDRRAAFNHDVVRDTQVVGSWKRSLDRNGVLVDIDVLERLDAPALQPIQQEVERYGQFMGSVARASIQCPDA